MNRDLSTTDVVLGFAVAGLTFVALASGLDPFGFAMGCLACSLLADQVLVFVHELGHAVAVVKLTRRRALIQIGSKPFTRRFSIGAIDVEWSRHLNLAHCLFDRSVPMTGRSLLLIALAGPAANLALAILLGAGALALPDHSSPVFWVLALTAGTSVLLAVGNLIPARGLPPWWPGAMGGDEDLSDGSLALLALRSGLGEVILRPPPRRLMSDAVRRAILRAGQAARAERSAHVGPDHLLLGLLDEGDGVAAQILRDCGFHADVPHDERTDLELQLTPAAKGALNRAKDMLTLRGDELIDTEHMLLALIEEPEGAATELLAEQGVDRAQVRRRSLQALTA